MSSDLRDGLARALAETLEDMVSGRVYAGRRDEGVVPPFTVVVVKQMRGTVRGFDRWYADVRVVHVSEVCESTSPQHEARVKELALAIEGMPQRGVDEVNGVVLDGMELVRVEDAVNEEDQVFGDVFVMEAGVGRYEE